MRILVVEDDDAVGGVILEMLSRWKMDTVRAADVQAARLCSAPYARDLHDGPFRVGDASPLPNNDGRQHQVYSKKKWTWRGGGVPREAAVVTIVGAEP